MLPTFRPLGVAPSHWLDADDDRPYSPFSSSYSTTLKELERELGFLDARDAWLQVVGGSHLVNRDGTLRADAKVRHPGVMLTIDTAALGTLVYETDRYAGRYGRAGWQENLRAITLGLESLRRVERYGIARRGQQYAGYRELGEGGPPGGTITGGAGAFDPDAITALDAAELLFPDDPDWLLEVGGEADVNDAYRNLAKSVHPDTADDGGGDLEAFRRLVAARAAMLEEVRRR